MSIRTFLFDTFSKASTAIGAAYVQVKIKTRYPDCKIFDVPAIQNSTTSNCIEAFKKSLLIIEEVGQKIIFQETDSEDRFHKNYERIFRDEDEFQPLQCYEVCSSAIRSIGHSDIQDTSPKYTWFIYCIGLVAFVDAVLKPRYKQTETRRFLLGTALAGALSFPVGIAVLDGMAAFWMYKIVYKIASRGIETIINSKKYVKNS